MEHARAMSKKITTRLVKIILLLTLFGCDFFYYQSVKKLEKAGYFEIARKKYEERLINESNSSKKAWLHYKIARCYEYEKNLAKAEKEYFKGIQIDSSEAEASYIALGQLLIKRGKYKKIIELYEKLLKKNLFTKEHGVFKLYLGRSYLELNLYSSAQKELNNLIIGNYSDTIKSNAYYFLGLLDLKLGEIDIGIKQIEKAIELNSKNPDPYISVAIEYAKKEDYKKAKDYLKDSILLDPNKSEAYHNLGHILQIEGDFDKAIELYTKALKLDNDLLETHYRLAILFIEKKNFDYARYHLNKIHDTKSTYINAKKYFGKIYMLEGSFELAISELESGLKLFPNDEEAIYLLAIAYGNLYLILREEKRASIYYNKELSRNPKSSPATIGVMKIEAAKKNPNLDTIVDLIRKAIENGWSDIEGLKKSPFLKNVIKNKRVQRSLETKTI